MWYGWRISREADPELSLAAADMARSSLRWLIWTAGSIYLAWHLLFTANRVLETVVPIVGAIMPVVVLTVALSLLLLKCHLLAAQAALQIGLAAAITLSILLLHDPDIILFYAFLPLLATLSVGWPAGLFSEALVIGLLAWAPYSSGIGAIPVARSVAIGIGGAFTGCAGWVATRTLLTVAQWSLITSEHAQRSTDEARAQRLELKQVQEDLVLANRELARLSERLKAMVQLAEEARRAKEEFVANVSHELRTPLNMILGFSEMIAQAPHVYGAPLPRPLLADIVAIKRNSEHLSRLVDDILDLSQLDAGRMALSREWASLAEIIDAAKVAVRALYDSKGLSLETTIPADLPSAFFDGTRIYQVVLNLLSNAGRFTEHGGVTVKAWQEQDHLVVSVTDTGRGIAPENQARLFEPFQQLDGSIRRRHGGSGLGLSISKRFVEMHGGRMWFDSQPGSGTTFYFNIPITTPSTGAALESDSALRWVHPYSEHEYRLRTRRSKAQPPNLVPRYVLLEEEGALGRLFGRYMDSVEVVTVTDASHAVAELERSPAQALIVNAPAADGLLFDKAHALPHGTPTISCWVPGEDEAARRLGVVRYLVKPISRDVLLETLSSLGPDIQTVLLVDDQPEVLQLFARMVTSAQRGYRVLQASSGERALDLLRERLPDVMLLDLIMPGMDGFQVLREKSHEPALQSIPVVTISARDPAKEPIVSDRLTVTQSGGLSAHDLLTCIQTLSQVLSPSLATQAFTAPADPAHSGTPDG